MTIPPEIQDLVDNPRETLEIELKQWLDLSAPIDRANTARHLCALANYGGGYLIFGIRDDLSLDPTPPSDLLQYSRDKLGGLVERYLTPTFQIDVFHVRASAAGSTCVVVRVPSHQSVPICARCNGPSDEKGRVQGLREGEHYLRLPGPKSEAIRTPEHWRTVIHRCVLRERQSLLESIGQILRPPPTSAVAPRSEILAFHDSMIDLVRKAL
jgi:predicted HTH transcriptional regulator